MKNKLTYIEQIGELISKTIQTTNKREVIQYE